MKTSQQIELEQLRIACNEIALAPDDTARAKTIQQLQLYISKLIVDAAEMPNIRTRASAGFRALRAESPQHDDDAAVAAQIAGADLAGDAAARAVARQAVRLAGGVWREQAEAIDRHVAGFAAQQSERPSDPTSLDREALCQFINSAVPGEGAVAITQVRAASIGQSKATLLIRLHGNKVLPDEIVLRKDQPINFLGTHVVDEYPAIERLYRNGVPVPQPFALEATGTVLGQPFFLCAKAEGEARGTIYYPPPQSRALLSSLAAALAKLHQVPISDLRQIGAAGPQRRDYIGAEFARYQQTWNQLQHVNPLMDAAFAWVRSHLDDAHGELSLVHNDYGYHNILIDEDRVSAVLDWEFIHIGNPAADLAYFKVDADQVDDGFAFFLSAYQQAGGRLPSQRELDFYEVWAHTRFAVMNYQVMAGVQQGQLTGLRNMLPMVMYLPKPIACLASKLDALLA